MAKGKGREAEGSEMLKMRKKINFNKKQFAFAF